MKKRIWTKGELTIAYYIAKWNYNGLGADEAHIVDNVIGDTTRASLNMQTANFRYLLGIEGPQLDHTSQLQADIVEEYKNKTVTQMRKVLDNIIEPLSLKIKERKVFTNNSKTKERANALNEQSELNFHNKLKAMRMHRRLKPLKK